MRSLYLCYFGVREPLVQTQVLPYLRELREGGVEIRLLTFEPELRTRWTEAELAEMRARLAGEGIEWFVLPYHKRPSLPATLYDIAAGALFAVREARRKPVDVLHARAHVAAAMGALAKNFTGARLLFDIRGFNPEEYLDAGLWQPGDLKFRLMKAAERACLRAADGYVVLTDRARAILFPGQPDTDARGRPVEVIPCCVDLARFRAAQNLDRDKIRAELGLAGRRVIVYTGSLLGFYLTEETVEFLAAARRLDSRTFAMILTQSPPEQITGLLQAAGLGETDYLVRKVPPAEVPRYLKAADLAVSFIKPSFSKQAASPTKLAEYLAAGLPVVCNAGVGDVDQVLQQDRVGVLLPELTATSYEAALGELERLTAEPDLAARCRDCAEARFDLKKVGGARYRRLYQRMTGA